MSTNTSASNLKEWHFGRYIEERHQVAKLVIRFTSLGELTKKPLVLPYSEVAYPKKVLTRLMDATADIDPVTDFAALTDRLKNLDTTNGLYLQKVGHHSDVFVTPLKVYGESSRLIVVDSEIAEVSSREIGSGGHWRRWTKDVAIPSEGSSFAMFGIALALAAPVYRFLSLSDGVIFNFAVRSGFGKSTVGMIAKSVTGQSRRLPTWKATHRGLDEELAASSDALFVLDDWEKINVAGKKSAHLQTTCHLITTGASKTYSKVVKENLPDLEWCCPVLTCGPHTIEHQAKLDGFQRTDGDRRRLIDIPIEEKGGLGIWDRVATDMDTGELSKEVTRAANENYGHLFNRWVKLMMNDRDEFVEDIENNLDKYFQSNRMHGDGGFENEITKKFGIVYAAGKKAIDEGLLPWSPKTFRNAVVKLNRAARSTITTDKQAVRSAISALNEATSDDSAFPTVNKSANAKFSKGKPVTGFILEDTAGRHLFIDSEVFHKIVGGEPNSKLLQDKLQEFNALKKTSEGKGTFQKTVNVAGKHTRIRFMKIELNAFDETMSKLVEGTS
ncbi:DUF927 domain-containing protein [Sulfitobacter geojensis]|uniref:DUF927 domain-containing protein n=1 Tax=Sulfitobacter geojensis TaxID=1342299 RepID=UPI0007DA2A0C|nr:DUF927 domain-containing protein [Sulfitobacter geojensis]OAN95737.1 hypothetical protein A8B74_15480 [Sulfitobacter geojensis]